MTNEFLATRLEYGGNCVCSYKPYR